MSQNLLEALHDVEAKLAVAPAVLLAVDFDGALTPFVAHPDLARVSTPVKQKLQSLANARNLWVVLFSGRDRTDLSDRVGVPGLIYAGNHGLEISGPGFVFVEPTALAWQESLPALRRVLTEQLRPIPGALVEDKGLTVTVHLRQVSADQHVEVRRAVYAALAEIRQPFRVEMAEKAL